MKTPEVKIKIQTESETKNLSCEFCAGIVMSQLPTGTNVGQYCVGRLSLDSTAAVINSLIDLVTTLYDSRSPKEQGVLDLMLIAKSSAESDSESLSSNPGGLQTEESDSSPDLDKVLRAMLGEIFGGDH